MRHQPQQAEIAERDASAQPVTDEPVPFGALDARSLLALQRTAGNAAVTARLAGAEASVPEPPAPERPEPSPYRSPALLLRSRLRARALQRALTTSGGEWDTDQYDLKQDVDGSGNKVDPAVGHRGLDIKLKFTPNDSVDAEIVGLTQSVQAYVGGSPNLTPAAATRAIPAADAQPLNTGPGETDQGTAVDRAQGYNNPIYGVSSANSGQLDDTNYRPGLGQEGWRYTDKAGTVQKRDAWLFDTPRRSGAAKDARHVFETTALATKGTQAGTYYGSVRWGWRTDSAGAHTKIDLAVISEGVPSSTFLKAAEIWNTGKSSTGAANVNLPVPDVKVTTGPVKLQPPIPMRDIDLLPGTRLVIVTDLVGPMLSGTVRVVDGPHTGITGEVEAAEWSNISDERS